MDNDLLLKALAAAQMGQKYAFATVIETTGKGTPRKAGAKMVVMEDGTLFGTIGGGRNEEEARKACLKAIRTGKSSLEAYALHGRKDEPVCGGLMKVFIEPYAPPRHLVICGAGHVALPLSVIAKLLQYHVTIIDDRKSLANKARFPHADKIMVGRHAERLAKVPMGPDTHVVIMTQGHEHDFACAKTIVRSKAGYIGVISSAAKRAILMSQLKKMRVPAKEIQRLHVPVGIDIGAQTPEEIAVSIAAELVAINNRESVGSSKFKIQKEST